MFIRTVIKPTGWIKVHYLDASALIKLFKWEKGSKRIRQYFEKESGFWMTSICFGEALGRLKSVYFNKKKVEKIKKIKGVKTKAKAIEKYLAPCHELIGYVEDKIQIDDIRITNIYIFYEVEKLVGKYLIDVSDAFQIVSIKHSYFSKLKEQQLKPILITADEDLAEAAKKEGLNAWYFIKEPSPK